MEASTNRSEHTIFIGMDVHKESFTLCCYSAEKDKFFGLQKIAPDSELIVQYLQSAKSFYDTHARVVCGYEAGCLGYSLYRELAAAGVECVILAPSTMPVEAGKKRVKTDKRDAKRIAQCLAFHTYKPVHVPTEESEEIKDFIRMRNDHKQALKRIKQQINAFCLRHSFHYPSGRHKWTLAHLDWLKKLKLNDMQREILNEYLLTLNYLIERIALLDKRIEALSQKPEFKDRVSKLRCFIGIKTITAMTALAEIGDFNRFADAEHFASYLGLTPGEDSSGDKQHRLGITKAGNVHVRRLLVEAAHCYNRGQVGYKSKDLKARQAGCPPEVIAYADRANVRLRKRYFRFLKNNKNPNVSCVAIARELACFIWGMMVNKYDRNPQIVS